MPASARPLGYIALGYWFFFWLMNGMDKFLHGVTVTVAGEPLFIWFGKNRMEQFGKYFDRLALPQEGIAPLLSACGVIELTVASLFFISLLGPKHYEAWIAAAFTATAVMFMGFSLWDVVVGDRAELLEHGTYMGVVFVTYGFVAFSQFKPVRAFSHDTENATDNRLPHNFETLGI